VGAAVLDIEADRGGLIMQTVAVEEADGLPADLTGFTGEMQVRASYDATDVLVEGVVTIDADDGLVTFEISGADTADATWLRGLYDVRIVDGSGEPEYVARGSILLRPTVTR
jgi:hypothetical protein